MYIYLTQNLINGKIYIGKSKLDSTSEKAKKYFGSGVIITQSFKKYGIKNFSKKILLDGIQTLQELNLYEKFYISLFCSQDLEIGYNISSGGDGSNLPTQSAESCLKRSVTLTGRKRSEQEKLAISIGQQNMSEEAKNKKSKKCSIAKLGKKHSLEHVEKNRNAYKCFGADHPHTKVIYIYTENNEHVYTSTGNFKKFCKENNLPYEALKESYQKGGKRLYNKSNSLLFIKQENIIFKGWYALIKRKEENES